MSADTWDDGAAYELYVGRWSRLVARQFVHWLAVPPQGAWLDFGCGTGALSQVILAEAEPRLVIGCDRSAGFTDFARQRTQDARAQFVVAELTDLPPTSGGFDAVVTGLVLNFLPDARGAVTALTARARQGGTVAAYVWDYADGMQMMRLFWDAAVTLDPGARDLDEGVRFPLCRPESLQQVFNAVGLQGLEIRSIDVPTIFRNFADYWTPFLGGQGPAPGYAMSLSPERRAALRNSIEHRLPVAADGTIALSARAWAARGIAA